MGRCRSTAATLAALALLPAAAGGCAVSGVGAAGEAASATRTATAAGPTVLVWCHYEATAGVVEALRREAEGWAEVMRVPFEPQGADVREL